jgi:hypothetical protein
VKFRLPIFVIVLIFSCSAIAQSDSLTSKFEFNAGLYPSFTKNTYVHENIGFPFTHTLARPCLISSLGVTYKFNTRWQLRNTFEYGKLGFHEVEYVYPEETLRYFDVEIPTIAYLVTLIYQAKKFHVGIGLNMSLPLKKTVTSYFGRYVEYSAFDSPKYFVARLLCGYHLKAGMDFQIGNRLILQPETNITLADQVAWYFIRPFHSKGLLNTGIGLNIRYLL